MSSPGLKQLHRQVGTRFGILKIRTRYVERHGPTLYHLSSRTSTSVGRYLLYLRCCNAEVTRQALRHKGFELANFGILDLSNLFATAALTYVMKSI